MAKQILLYPFKNYIQKKGLDPDTLMQWLEFLSPSIVKWKQEFVEDEDVTYGLGPKLSGGSITGLVASTNNGICRLATSASANKYIGVFPATSGSLAGAAYVGNNSPVIWARIKVDGADNCKVEVGFTDDDTNDAGAVNNLATPTTNAHDCAVWCYDTNDTGGLYWQGVHSANSQTPSKVEPAKFLPVAATYEWLGVALLGGAVKFMHCDAYGNPNYESGWQATGITATDALVPWIFVQARSGTEILLDIDYVIAYQRRTSDDD